MKIKAFTLLETLVVLGIFTLMFTITFEILSANRRSFDIGLTKQDVENQARLGLESMSRELYKTNSNYVTISPNAAIITFQVPIDYGAGGSLIWGAGESGEPATGGYKIRYSLNAQSQLIREVLDTTDTVVSTRVLANAVNNLTFSLADNLLSIGLTAQRTVSGRTLSQPFSSRVTFRN